jgi:hypothetical protein
MGWILASGLRFGRLVVALAIGLTVIGIAQLRSAPVDVYPEFMRRRERMESWAMKFEAARWRQSQRPRPFSARAVLSPGTSLATRRC